MTGWDLKSGKMLLGADTEVGGGSIRWRWQERTAVIASGRGRVRHDYEVVRVGTRGDAGGRVGDSVPSSSARIGRGFAIAIARGPVTACVYDSRQRNAAPFSDTEIVTALAFSPTADARVGVDGRHRLALGPFGNRQVTLASLRGRYSFAQ